jgi:hypothetical protein
VIIIVCDVLEIPLTDENIESTSIGIGNDANLLIASAIGTVSYDVAIRLHAMQISQACFPSNVPNAVWTGEYRHFSMMLRMNVDAGDVWRMMVWRMVEDV